MTKHEECQPSDEVVNDQQFTSELPGPGDGYYEASSVAVIVGNDGTNPFDVTLQLCGDDKAGGEITLGIRLSNGLIVELTQQMREAMLAQLDLLQFTDERAAGSGDPTGEDENNQQEQEGEGRLRQFFDPMGIRYLKERSPRTTVILGVVIGSLVLLAFVLQLVRG